MSTSSAETDKLYWLAYCALIKKQIGGDLGPNEAIFFGTTAQRGPPAGDADVVPIYYTNSGIYDIADHLLDPAKLFYEPSEKNSYVRSLMNYLAEVDLGGHPSDVNLLAIKQARDHLDSVVQDVKPARDQAFLDFKDAEAQGMTGGLTFPQWAVTNAPAYNAVEQNLQDAGAALQMAYRTAYGDHASQWTTDNASLQAALYGITYTPGINMECTSLTPDGILKVLDNKGATKIATTDLFLRPDYSSPEYGQAVKYFDNPANGGDPEVFTISMDQGKTVDDHSFGQTHTDGDSGIDFLPWLSFSSTGEFDSTSESLDLGSNAANIQFQLTWEHAKKVSLVPGTWDLGDPSSTYRLKASSTANLTTLVRPTQMLVANNVGYTVIFDASIKSLFDSKVTETKKTGGAIKLFGITISVDATRTESTEHTTHIGTWDSTQGKFIVTPTRDAGFATVLAIVGEKLKVV